MGRPISVAAHRVDTAEAHPSTARRNFLKRAGGALAFSGLLPGLAYPQDHRLRQSTILVGAPAGGATDKLARMYANGMPSFAETIIVENKGGAGGAIAYEYVKSRGAKDGSLMFLAPAYPIVISPHVVRDLPYDPIKDFVPIGIAARSLMTFGVGPAVPKDVKTLEDYLRWCKANPKLAIYAAQTGSAQHLMGTSFSLAAKVRLDNISYKGDAPAIQDVLGGHVPAIILPAAAVRPYYQSGQLRVLATAAASRPRLMPDLPTFREQGFQDIVFQDWMGMFAAAGTQAAVVQKVNDTMANVSRSAEGMEMLATLGFEPETATPEQFASVIKTDYQRYGDMIERTGFREAFAQAAGR